MANDAKRVLIIDDAAMMRLVIRNLLVADPAFRVVGACSNGAEALEQLKALSPDIILVDIEMPVMDGLTFLRNARLKTRAKIVILSSVAAEGSERAHKARALGADAVLQKPSGAVSLDLADKSGTQILDTLHRLAA